MLAQLNFHHHHTIFPKNLKFLFVAQLMRSVGIQFSVFFLPLFFYQTGSRLLLFPVSAFQNGLIFIGLYFLFERTMVLFASIPVARFITQLGVRKSMILSQVLYLMSLALYVFGEKNPVYFLPILLIEGVRIPLFWCSYYTLFSENAVYKHMGQSVGTSTFFTKLIEAAIPALSGLMIVEFGFSSVFYTAIFFHTCCIFALMFVSEHRKEGTASITELKQWLSEPGFRLLTLSLAGKYVMDMLRFLWPFFVVLILGTADKVGFIYFVVLFVSLLLVYFSGWYVDHAKGKKPFAISGSVLGGLWIARFFVNGIWSIMALDIFDRLADSVFNPFYEALLLKRGKGDTTLNYFAYRETIISVAGLFFWSALIIYFTFFDSFRSFLLLGSIGTLMSLQLREKKIAKS